MSIFGDQSMSSVEARLAAIEQNNLKISETLGRVLAVSENAVESIKLLDGRFDEFKTDLCESCAKKHAAIDQAILENKNAIGSVKSTVTIKKMWVTAVISLIAAVTTYYTTGKFVAPSHAGDQVQVGK